MLCWWNSISRWSSNSLNRIENFLRTNKKDNFYLIYLLVSSQQQKRKKGVQRRWIKGWCIWMECHLTIYRFCAGFCKWLKNITISSADVSFLITSRFSTLLWQCWQCENLHVAAQVLPFQVQVLLSEYVRRKGSTSAVDVLKWSFNDINISRGLWLLYSGKIRLEFSCDDW